MSATKHPGWAIKVPADDVSGDEWVTNAHGLRCGEATCACVMITKAAAEELLAEWGRPGEVVEAWEPLVATLWWEVDRLRKANKLSPSDIDHAMGQLEDVVCLLERAMS